MTRKDILTGAVGGVAAAALLAGAHFAVAAEAHSVNPAPTAPPPSVAPASFADIVQRVAPAVVSIEVVAKPEREPAGLQGGGPNPFEGTPFEQFFGQMPNQAPRTPVKGAGSGFFISADGYIVTNNHVVEDATKITVRTNDGQSLDATLVGRDPATDLAVVKVQGHEFPFVNFEDRAKPRVGDWVVAVGNPFNLGGTATAGIVSALNRANISGSSYVDYMQIDAPINRGNSGGPSFDLYGRVVGVNSAIFSPSGGSVGIGFDIPADVAASVSRQLIASGKVDRGYIGAAIQDVTPEIADSLGVKAHAGALVADVTPGGPSDHAGLKSGDLILGINGHPITSGSDLTRQVALARPGDAIRLDVRRDGRTESVTVRSGLRPSEKSLAENDRTPATPGEGSLGLMVAPNPNGGLTVQGVAPGSAAADRGLQRGDVIEQAGGRAANTPADVRAAVAQARAAGRKSVLLRVARNGRKLFVPVEIDAEKG